MQNNVPAIMSLVAVEYCSIKPSCKKVHWFMRKVTWSHMCEQSFCITQVIINIATRIYCQVGVGIGDFLSLVGDVENDHHVALFFFFFQGRKRGPVSTTYSLLLFGHTKVF